MEIGFSLGSNQGDRLTYLQAARDGLLLYDDATLVDQSSVYSTDPVDVASDYLAYDFLNAVILVESEISAEEWLVRLGNVEQGLGRVRSGGRNEPRTVDIDILFAGHRRIESVDLTIPHPRWSERNFVLAPLTEVRPHLVLPGEPRAVMHVWQALRAEQRVEKMVESW
ncbi:MAG: 2-amino-4-hydroxy-6-hydroxymethyldihydropteridine diphosphokinase [Pontiellaceae bacterium]|nr:2-amino-4-hydroxy-6-hydroxymethyldihydropteridine diphosphokinase [Verrucomicrobiota bacterium]